MSLKLQKVVERARSEPDGRFHSLAHLIDVQALETAYRCIRKGAAVGVDGGTKDQYGRNLEKNLLELHGRLKSNRYRHQPIRRVNIPKDGGRTRPIGISALEDKIVQGAVRDVLEAIYEQDFCACSFGFRPERNAHGAIRTLDKAVHQGAVNWILEADIKSFFDSLDRTKLKELLQIRVADGALMRIIGKLLRVGVLDGVELSTADVGTAQGSILSPLLGNIYLHYVLDVWFDQVVKPKLIGQATLVRYADEFVIGFERHEDAQRVMEWLHERMESYGLELHPDKTQLLPFGRPPSRQQWGKGPATFDFLGFTFYWRRTRRGRWNMWCKTRASRLQRAINVAADWCRRHRHDPVAVQHAALSRRMRGHFNYFGVSGNCRSMRPLVEATERNWIKWLRRRSNKSRLTWQRFAAILKRYPLPTPVIRVRIWGP